MHFPPEFIDQLRMKITLSVLIGKSVKLVKKGREWSGLCPFHQEKTASFTVNDEKKFYHCFGCGANGEIVKFAMETRGLSFVDAVTNLANDAGVALPVLDKKEIAKYDRIHELHEIMQQAVVFYQNQLEKSNEVLSYLHNRKINNNSIKEFMLGFAPATGQALFNHLTSLKIDSNLMVEAGLVGVDPQRRFYDRFRGRVMFPIANNHNKIIAFGGRALGDAQPKYLNSPETILFQKSEVLYGESRARAHACKSGRVIVVEGYIDVIAMHNAGFKEVVAALGTAVTTSRLAHLWQISAEPIFCLDGDLAGKKAMHKVATLSLPLLKSGNSVNFAVLPQGHDPDETINTYGASFVEKLLTNALPLSEYLWQHEFTTKLNTPEQKAAFETKLLAMVEQITEYQLKASYKRFFLQKIWQFVKKNQTNFVHKKDHQTSVSVEVKSSLGYSTDITIRYEYNLTALIISQPMIIYNEEIEEEYLRIEFQVEMLDKIRAEIFNIRFGLNESCEFQENLVTELAKLGFRNDLEYLCGEKSTFIDKIANKYTVEEYQNIWLQTFKQYQLVLLSTEYQNALNEMTEESLYKALEFKKQILILEKNINDQYFVEN